MKKFKIVIWHIFLSLKNPPIFWVYLTFRGGLTTAINSSITTLTIYKADNYGIIKEFQSEKTIFLPGESFLDVKVSDVCLITQARLRCHLEQHLDHGRILTTFLQYPKRNSEKEKSKWNCVVTESLVLETIHRVIFWSGIQNGEGKFTVRLPL